jgi:single-strand DNA-binding protein
MYLNKVLIYGNLTRDPELKSLPSGMQVCSFSLATNRVYKDREGARQESTYFHNIVVFGRQAETSAQYLKKGAGAFVEGRIQTRTWDKDGVKQYRTEIVADRVQFGPRTGGSDGGGGQGGAQRSSEKTDTNTPGNGPVDYPEEDINPDDIPF